MEPENIEQEILLQPEVIQVGKVNSVNGMTGDVVLTTSDLENTSDYQTGSDVASAISTHNSDEEAHPYIQGQFAGKQDKLTAGSNIQISEQNVISATDTTYSAGNGINISGANAISVDTTVVATQQNLSNEVTNRENADIYLQQQIDGISASSDVVDIVGTYAELQAYDTQHLKDNDIIKVLQDETQGGATTYYRWSTTTQIFTLIGQEGPYYTKAAADSQFVPQTRTVNGKALSANITLNASDVSALGTSDVVQTTGSSTSQVMSQNAVTTQLNTKLNTSDYVVDAQLANTTNPVQNQVLNGLFGNMPTDFFSGSATTNLTPSTSVVVNNGIGLADVEMLGDTTQQTYSGANLYNYQDVYSQSQPGVTVDSDGWITFSYDNTSGGSVVYLNYFSNPMALSASQSYAAVVEVKDVQKTVVSGSGNTLVGVIGDNQNTQFAETFSIASNSLSVGTFVGTATTKSDISTSTIGVRAFLQVPAGTNISVTLRISVLADTSVTPQTFVYQPYVGGIPSPNPDYPQNVNAVTGVQTVTVSDGMNTDTYTIDLGATELCKIGTYQDYIYKSGDDWYVHKATGKLTLDGTQGYWGLSSNANMYYKDFAGMPIIANNIVGPLISDLYTACTQNDLINGVVDYGIALRASGSGLGIRNKDVTGSDGITTWLTNHNTTVYYALVTPTDTQITDSTLISQLEALLGATTYEGQTNFEVTASSLAGILDLTAINANANGMIYKLRGA